MARYCTVHLDFETEADYLRFLSQIHNDQLTAKLFSAALLGVSKSETANTADRFSRDDRLVGTLPDKPKPEPKKEDPHKLLDGWRSWEHRRFYRQAIRQANRVLKEAAEADDKR